MAVASFLRSAWRRVVGMRPSSEVERRRRFAGVFGRSPAPLIRKGGLTMLSPQCLHEFRTAWLPNISDAGLDRLIDLLDKASPLLVHGAFTKALPMGCLATHVAWNHPETSHLNVDAGICWLHGVAGLNPATSHVIREWDSRGAHDWTLRADLAAELHGERDRRREFPAESVAVAELVNA
jgi:hypothetical protein